MCVRNSGGVCVVDVGRRDGDFGGCIKEREDSRMHRKSRRRSQLTKGAYGLHVKTRFKMCFEK